MLGVQVYLYKFCAFSEKFGMVKFILVQKLIHIYFMKADRDKILPLFSTAKSRKRRIGTFDGSAAVCSINFSSVLIKFVIRSFSKSAQNVL